MQVNDSIRGVGIKNQPLSERQQAILRFVQDYLLLHKHPPSTREIGQGVGISSTSNVIYHINRLVDYGYLARQPGTSRTVIVLAAGYEQIDEPLVRDWAVELAALRAENRRLREWCRQLERERAWEREQYQAMQAG
jgi:SOS-response transcriptional repressor LexA